MAFLEYLMLLHEPSVENLAMFLSMGNFVLFKPKLLLEARNTMAVVASDQTSRPVNPIWQKRQTYETPTP
jgi:hypothetical protein